MANFKKRTTTFYWGSDGFDQFKSQEPQATTSDYNHNHDYANTEHNTYTTDYNHNHDYTTTGH